MATDPQLLEAQQRAAELINEIRTCQFADISPDGELLALAALMRSAHLLEAIATGPRIDNDPLSDLGFRDILETTINGLFCLAQPDEFTRFVVEDIRARENIGKHLDQSEELQPFLDQCTDMVDGAKGQMHFGQRLDIVADELPSVVLDANDVGRTKAMYASLSNFTMHGGAGVLGDYLAEGADGVGIHPLTHPPGFVAPIDAINMAVGMTGKLFRAAKDRFGADPA